MDDWFWAHPRDNHMTYLQHLQHSWGLGCTFIRLAIQAFVHGVVPGLFTTTSSDAVKTELPEMLEAPMVRWQIAQATLEKNKQ